MVKKFKNWYFKYGFLFPMNAEEASEMRKYAVEFGGTIKKHPKWVRELLKRAYVPFYLHSYVYDVITFRGKDSQQVIEILRSISKKTGGRLILKSEV